MKREVNVSIFFGPDQWATLEIMASDLLHGKADLTGEMTMTVDGRQLKAVVSRVDTSDGPVAIVVVSPPPAGPTIDQLRAMFPLTQKEAEVALLLCAGRSNKDVARRLRFRVSTAAKHTEKVLSKVGVNSRKHILAAVLNAIDTGAPTALSSDPVQIMPGS
jgi:DNA-binding CsgD family transcriptional regulator